MKVYLLRHTSLNVRENTFYGQTDLDVSENFLDELSEIKRKIIKYKIKEDEIEVFFERLKSFCVDTTKLNKDIFVVAHAGSIICIISYLAGIPFERLVRENWKKIGYGSLSILKKESRDYTIELFGDNVYG